MSRRIAVVGSGIGGLTAALLLERQGYDVTVYERSGKVGGRVAFEEEGPYRIDQGPTIVLLPDMLKGILAEGGIAPERLELLRCDPLYRIHYRSGRVLTKVADREAQTAEIDRLYPGEGRGFQRFMKDMDGVYVTGQQNFIERDFPRRRDFFTLGNVKLMRRLRAYQSVKKAAGSYFRSEELRDAFSLQSLYIGGTPFATPGIYSLLPYAEYEYGIWMLKGGYGTLPKLIHEELAGRGVTFRLNTEVRSLIVEQKQCRGVVTELGEERYDAVLYNGDFPNISGLLSEQVPAKRRYRPSTGCVLVYLGVSKTFPEALTHQFFLPDNLTASLKQVYAGRIPDDPSFYVFNPAALDPAAAPPGESVLYFLIPVPFNNGLSWEQETPALVERVLAAAEERGLTDLRRHITWSRVRTPLEAERDGLYGGGSFGIAPILSQSGVYRPQPKPFPIGRLAAAGASIHPGGGVPIVMQGAKLAVNQLIKELET
ncbi:phytoene desaturase family protein [Paenibacillus sp. JX-17]|uniref:Phytoene desaturase family protein n=1 Tax=Paenibacillus lacisoli TaxID=3064525 RepID=A0ABT9CB54_9BACL|nr:phytoene desaturase family protein [Paenibacillus sp. JX-17]MDO7906495.1 phytoene desaturase family protein [Paenibacillus sp. JX-17]